MGMRISQQNSKLSNILLLLIALIITTTTATASLQYDSTIISAASPPDPPQVCKGIDCLQGTCVPTTEQLLGWECDCYPGWKKLNPVPFCMIPNCTFNAAGCGSDAPPPPPPATSLIPTDPCFLVWCLYGECVADGASHSCQCESGSFNLLNKTDTPCIKNCNLGADCHGVQIGPPVPPPPPPPPTTSSAPPPIGSRKGNGVALPPNCARNFKALSTVLVAAVILIWI